MLAGPNEDKVPRQGICIFLSENNHIVSGATFSKDLNCLPLCDYLKSLFPSKLGEFDDIEILMPVHSKLLSPNLAPGQQLSAFLLQKIFKDRPPYIRPSKAILGMSDLQSSKKRKTETKVNPENALLIEEFVKGQAGKFFPVKTLYLCKLKGGPCPPAPLESALHLITD